MFNQQELYRLQLALESKISDDIAYIKIVRDEIKKKENHYDNKFLDEGKEILLKDVELKEKVIDLRYAKKPED
jgi:hypothetical protein